MEVFTGKLTCEGVRPPLGRALVPKEDYGSALYMTQTFFFSHIIKRFLSKVFILQDFFPKSLFYNVQ